MKFSYKKLTILALCCFASGTMLAQTVAFTNLTESISLDPDYNAWTDVPGLSLTITPTAETSKIKLQANVSYFAPLVEEDSFIYITNGITNSWSGSMGCVYLRFVRDDDVTIGSGGPLGATSAAAEIITQEGYVTGDSYYDGAIEEPKCIFFFDTAGTVSPITYKVQFKAMTGDVIEFQSSTESVFSAVEFEQ